MDQNSTPQPVSPRSTEQEAQAAVQQVMPPEKKPGRKALTIFAIAVLMGLVGYGVYAWQNSRVATLQTQVDDLKKEATTKAVTKADPYAGWKTYTTKYEKLTFKYPSDYTIKDTSAVAEGIVTPGTDRVVVTSPDGYKTDLALGLSGIGGACPDAKVVLADPITVAGKSMYINYIDSGDGFVSSQLLSESRDYACFGGFRSKNVVDTSAQKEPAINLISASSNSLKTKSVTTYKSNLDVKNATLIIESLSY